MTLISKKTKEKIKRALRTTQREVYKFGKVTTKVGQGLSAAGEKIAESFAPLPTQPGLRHWQQDTLFTPQGQPLSEKALKELAKRDTAAGEAARRLLINRQLRNRPQRRPFEFGFGGI